MAWPALGSGRLLEPFGDERPRGMIVHDKTRLIGRLPPSVLFDPPAGVAPLADRGAIGVFHITKNYCIVISCFNIGSQCIDL